MLASFLALQPTAVVARTDGVELRLGGTIQARGQLAHTYQGPDQERTGFGIRRLRLLTFAKLSRHASLFIQLGGAGGTVVPLDARAEWHATRQLTLRLGRFIGAQPKAFGRTIHPFIDAVDRPVVAVEWARRTVGADGRDFGLEAIYATSEVEWRAFLHNGTGSWDRAIGNFRQEAGYGDPVGGGDGIGLGAASTSVEVRPRSVPGLGLGAYVGINDRQAAPGSLGGRGRRNIATSVHGYFGEKPGSQPFRLKLDVVAMRHAGLSVGVDEDGEALSAEEPQTFLGASLLGAAQVARGWELFTRVEAVAPDLGREREPSALFLTPGVTLSTSALRGAAFHHERATLASAVRVEGDGLVALTVTLQAQLAY